MADPRTFTLIGEFKDGITPELAKINKQLASLKSSFGNIGGKGARTAAKDMGRFNASVSSLTDSLKLQNQALKSATMPLREYRTEIKRTASALERLNATGGNTKGLNATNRALTEQLRLLRAVNSAGGNRSRTTPRSSGGGGVGGMRPRGGGGGAGGGAGGGGGGYAGAVFGNQLANMVTAGVIKGFEVGVSIMQKPFQAFANALGERISDELGDIQAAGGLFAISKRQKDPFVRDFDQAIQLQQEMNLSMAKMANSLPGSTEDFVNVQKRVTDTIARVVTKDLKGATAVANQIRATEEGKRFYGGKQLNADVTTKEERAQLTRENINVISGELTKLTVLAGLTGGGKGGGGVRGAMGPYGLPGLSERMISDTSITMGSMQRYAAIFRDPAIKDALERNIPKLNAEMAGTPDRVTAFFNMMKEIVTPELVAKLRRSVSGINEAIRSTFFTPEAGIFGLGRKLKDMGVVYNDFGQAVDENGKAVKGMTEAAKANLSLYEVLRDTYANTMVALMPVIENLGQIFDPLQEIGDVLKDSRAYTAKFLENFYFYRNSLEKYAKDLGGMSGKKLLEGLDLRAALLNINNLFRGLGIFSTKEFESTTDHLLDPSFNPVDLISKMIKKFLSSDAATAIGEKIGEVIGTVFKQVSDLMTSITDSIGNEAAPGFAKGFKKAGGFASIQNIFVQLIKMFFTAFATAVKEMPMLSLMGAGLVLAPAVIGAAVTSIVEGLFMGAVAGGALKGAAAEAAEGAAASGGRRGIGAILGGMFGPTAAMKGARAAAGAGISAAAAPTIQGAKMLAAVTKSAVMAVPVLGKTLQLANAARKFIPGGAVLGAGVDFALAKATGQSTGKAIAGAVGSVLGGTLGSVFGPLGTVAGSVLGSMAGNAIYSNFIPAGRAQENAAALQKQAADLQLQASKRQELGDKYGVGDLNYSFGQAAEVNKRFEALGYGSNQLVKTVQKEYFERNIAVENLKKLDAAFKEAESRLTAQKLDPKALARQLKPYEDAAKAAAAKVKAEQSQLNAAMSKLPIKVQDAFINNIKNVNFQVVANALAVKVGQMQLNAAAAGYRVAPPPPRIPKPGDRKFIGPVVPEYKGGLGDAISKEMRMKPPGSNLVIANSSETVIPAAGGYGMEAFIGTMRAGFNSIVQTYAQAQQKQEASLNKINSTLVNNQQQTNTRLSTLEKKFTSPSMGGLGGGSIGGGVDAFTPMAQQMGLSMTSGYRPGDPGWHGANRARDFSNGTGPTPQMLQFAQMLASRYGRNLKELIYTPLGFSIKNGQQVAPYAQGSHYNHVHVAYANGIGQGMAFNSLRGAQAWENSMVSGSVKVGSVTANSGEGFGGSPININAPITINQQPGQSADELASIVAMKIGEAVADARAASIFV